MKDLSWQHFAAWHPYYALPEMLYAQALHVDQ